MNFKSTVQKLNFLKLIKPVILNRMFVSKLLSTILNYPFVSAIRSIVIAQYS